MNRRYKCHYPEPMNLTSTFEKPENLEHPFLLVSEAIGKCVEPQPLQNPQNLFTTSLNFELMNLRTFYNNVSQKT